jgi:hypothetical protein
MLKLGKVHNNPTLQQNVVQSIHQWVIIKCADAPWHEHIDDESYSSELKLAEIAPSCKICVEKIWRAMGRKAKIK